MATRKAGGNYFPLAYQLRRTIFSEQNVFFTLNSSHCKISLLEQFFWNSHHIVPPAWEFTTNPCLSSVIFQNDLLWNLFQIMFISMRKALYPNCWLPKNKKKKVKFPHRHGNGRLISSSAFLSQRPFLILSACSKLWYHICSQLFKQWSAWSWGVTCSKSQTSELDPKLIPF